jgi:SNF2 family DNA or RNA helicase
MRIALAQPPWSGDTIVVTFPYDPTLLGIVRGVPGRKWVPSRHAWTIPATPEAVRSLRARIPTGSGIALVVDPALAGRLNERQQALNNAAAVKADGDSDPDFEFITKPYAHQRAGLDFLLTIRNGALLWEMGTGKTKTAIDYAESMIDKAPVGQIFRVLVICPNTVKRNWGEEIRKHAGHDRYVIDKPVGSTIYTITNCEKLSLKASLAPLLAREWDLVIVDESTRFKSPTAKRTKALHKLRAKRRVILTGTPITGKPQDAWAQLEFVEPGILGSWWAFVDRYLMKDYFGAISGVKASGAAELRERIESRSYRVLKENVLDLPPKVYEDRWVELKGDQKRAYEQMKNELRVAIEGVHAISAPTILTQLLRLTQITAGLVGAGTDYTWLEKDNAKVAEMDTLLNDDLEGKQVVIFGLYQRELEALARRYVRGQVLPIIYGPTPEAHRHDLIADFQRGAQQYLFVQAHTGGIGINLTAAQYAVYYTRGWSLEDYLQSQDRLHRIGQQGTVTIIHLGATGTVDAQIAKALAEKQNMADLLTGDKARRLAAEVLR